FLLAAQSGFFKTERSNGSASDFSSEEIIIFVEGAYYSFGVLQTIESSRFALTSFSSFVTPESARFIMVTVICKLYELYRNRYSIIASVLRASIPILNMQAAIPSICY